MPRSFDLATEYEGTVEEVHRALRDEGYWLSRLTDSGADDYSLDALTAGPDGSVTVTTTQVLRADRLPGIVTQFHRGDLAIQREEHWDPVSDGRATGFVNGVILGAPVTLDGAMTLAPERAGEASRLTCKATVEVRVPLVGGKLENLIGGQLVDVLIAEQRFTTAWIAENA